MAITPTRGFQIHALPPDVLAEVRAAGAGVPDNPVEHTTATGGEPLRCCLRDASAGEELMLFGYEPPLPASPYREKGAVFAHSQPCGAPVVTDAYPADWYGRPQVLRAYDSLGRIHDATAVHDGQDPEAAIAAVLAHPGVAWVHSRNIAWGCYMFAISPAG